MSEKQGKIYLYQVTGDTTLTNLANEKDSIILNYKGKIQDFLALKFNNLSNLDRIYNKYTEQQKNDYKSQYLGKNLDVVNSGTELILDSVQVDLFSISGKNIFLEQKNVGLYLADSFKTINNDPNYIPVLKFQSGDSIVNLKNYTCSVWVYSKALNQIKDITKFVTNLTTSSNVNSGGSFSITLDGIGNLDDTLLLGEDVVNIYKLEEGSPTMSYWQKWFQQKDIVWIRWEKLELEKKRKTLLDTFDVDKSELKDQVYDMIGLINEVQDSTNFSSLDRTTTISGRDLMQLLAEDAAYFYNVLFCLGSDALMWDTQDKSKIFKRNIFKEGVFESFFTFEQRKIADSIGFIINQLANLGIVDNSLFTGYTENNKNTGSRLGERRKQALRIKGDGGENSDYIEWQEVNGIWQIIDVFVDEKLDRRTQVDSLLSTSQGTLLGMIQSICQEPFVEFMGDTYGDKYVFFARQKIWRGQDIKDYWNDVRLMVVDYSDIESSSFEWETEYYTSYEIQPNSSFLGYNKFTALSYVPVVFLSKIAETFGNKPYVQADSYIDERALVPGATSPIVDPFRKAVIEDLGYLIEINSYLPFTRKGTIVVNGDRRYKVGTWIYYKPTNEFFYVDAVSQTGSWSQTTINRTTTLTVSRGMVQDYIWGKAEKNEKGEPIKNIKGEEVNVSYFNIVDVDTIVKTMKDTLTENNISQTKLREEKKVAFNVNEDIFNFFLKRRQIK